VGIDSSLTLSERHETRTTTAGIEVLAEPGAAATVPRVRSAGALPAGAALLSLERGPGAGSLFLLDRDTTLIGRSDSDIVLDGVTVSHRHAEVRRHGSSFIIVDVGSFNGTYLNRSPVDSAVMAEGDEIQVGKFRLIFHGAPPGADPAVAGSFVAAEPSADARPLNVTGKDI
jgi:pSer/pThr/pTyr-binding forkhead associated (FHA) protein